MTIKKIIVCLIILVTASTITLFGMFLNMGKSVMELERTEDARLVSLFLADELRDSVRKMTSSVRQFVVTGDERFAERHMEILMIRNGEKPRPGDSYVAPEQLVSLYVLMERTDYSEKERAALTQSHLLSDKLAERETEAINAILGLYPDAGGGHTITGTPDRNRAAELVFGLEYEAEVAGIMEPFTEFRNELRMNTEKLIAAAEGKYNRSVLMVWIVFSGAIVLLGVFTFMMINVITKPLVLCDTFAKRVAAGDFGSTLDYNSDNEIGSLASSLRCMVEALVERINLKEHLRYYDAVISSAEAGIILVNRDGIITSWNAGSECILGYKPDEILGRTMFYCTPEESRSGTAGIFERLSKGESITQIEVTRKHRDGRLIVCSGSHTPIFDNSGNFNGFVVIFHDITEKKRMERDYEKAVAMAEAASKTKSMFLANMSHEIRTPLNGIIGFAELALDGENLADKTKEYLNKIKRSADGLMDVVNGILDISKIESGKIELEKIRFDLRDIMITCKSINEIRAAEKGIVLFFYSEPVAGEKLLGDPVKLRQVLLNLISNAIKFTESGIVKVKAVVTEQSLRGVRVMFEVSDSGIGMSGEQLKNVFEPFTQADSSTTRNYGGTGLGLTIAKNFVEIMGGFLVVESTPGLGSKFSFTLSFDTVNEPETDSLRKNPEVFAEKPLFMGDILVCEDNAINRDVIVEQLKKTGLNPIVAGNGRQGVNMAFKRMNRGRPFDLILMDIHMPVMDGLEAASELIEKGNTAPVIALTANAASTDRENYLRHGMTDYLSKPFTSKELWTCLSKYLTPLKKQSPSGMVSSEGEAALNGTEKKTKPLIVNDILDEITGIKRAADDPELYRQMQKKFAGNNRNTISVFNETIRGGNLEEAFRIAHSLKGSAKTIGAGKTAEAASKIEASLSIKDLSGLGEQTAALDEALCELIGVLDSAAENEQSINAGMLSPEPDEAAVLIDTLAPLLAACDLESRKYLAKVKTFFSSFGEICGTLAAQIEEYNFPAAYKSLLEIKEKLAEKRA